MTRVVIVGKTIMKSQRCIGALGSDDSKSYRLLSSTGRNFPANTEFSLGQVWDVDLRAESNLICPHTENHRVIRQQHVRTLSMQELTEFVQDRICAPTVTPKQLFDGCMRFTSQSKALIYRYGTRPKYSTGFWRFDKTLYRRNNENEKVRYLYCVDDVSCDFGDEDLHLDVPYVGCDDPPEFIPSGTLLRFSLSGEYRAGKYIGFWLQLSGWFL